MITFELIFDNAGGITFQTEAYVHSYDCPKEAATDVIEFLDSGSTDDWEGNQPEFRVDTDSSEFMSNCDNGGYILLDQDDMDDAEDYLDSSSGNIQGFFRCIHRSHSILKGPDI